MQGLSIADNRHWTVKLFIVAFPYNITKTILTWTRLQCQPTSTSKKNFQAYFPNSDTSNLTDSKLMLQLQAPFWQGKSPPTSQNKNASYILDSDKFYYIYDMMWHHQLYLDTYNSNGWENFDGWS